MNAKLDFGSRFKEARENSGLKKSDVARELDVSHQSVQQWENGQTSPRGERMRKLAALFNVPVEFLAFGKVEQSEANSKSDAIQAEKVYEDVSIAFTKTMLELSDIGWIKTKNGITPSILADIMMKNLRSQLDKNN
ncbi:helix-turn-helix domain-containing protein [Pseudoalteromonas sp. S16_S37]|uniref:helix-turn-helix domain-containing protein n=1 Tax=Pseudoalteromonas sp. S16_S37 TaxID=2720228 RepID=UPI001681AC26|nr:helix-turn-helix transcriptional regulator [Pseudoalteromonas sp. S16_S37]MBD1583468.1 helix-turn-helix transcriptional regulator [Pseudoalteromonas sp. S16_S37]